MTLGQVIVGDGKAVIAYGSGGEQKWRRTCVMENDGPTRFWRSCISTGDEGIGEAGCLGRKTKRRREARRRLKESSAILWNESPVRT